VERIIIPDSTIALDYMLQKFTNIVSNFTVYPDNMRRNLEKTMGLVFSQALLLALTRKGTSREEAYQMVQNAAMQVWETGEAFQSIVMSSEAFRKHLTDDEIAICFDTKAHMRHVNFIFERVGLID